MLSRILSAESQAFITSIFGSLSLLESSRVMYSVNLHAASSRGDASGLCVGGSNVDADDDDVNSKLTVILKNEGTPKFPIDWRMFSFLRSLATTRIVTGMSVRKEAHTTNFTTDYCGQPDWEALANRSQSSFFVLSRSLTPDDIMNLPLFSLPNCSKLVTSTAQLRGAWNGNLTYARNNNVFAKFLSENCIKLAPEMKDLNDAINYLKLSESIAQIPARTTTTNEPNNSVNTPEISSTNIIMPPPNKILVESGITSTASLLTSPTSPLDLLVLSVYRGELEHNFMGDTHPSIKTLSNNFTLSYTSKRFAAHKGTIQFYSFTRRTEF